MRLTLRREHSESDLAKACEADDLNIAHANLVKFFWARVARKQHQRSTFVVASKHYDMVDSTTGEIRMFQHSRQRNSIAGDCYIPYADVPFGSHRDASNHVDLAKESLPLPVAGESCAYTLATAVVKRMLILVDIVGAEIAQGQDCLDLNWKPSLDIDSTLSVATDPGLLGATKLQLSASGPGRPGSLISWLLGGKVELQQLLLICDAAREILQAQPIVSEVSVPAKVFGDLHGQLRDLLLLFSFYGCPGQELGEEWTHVSYVFNGDWVDRGQHQLEVVILLLCLKIVYPDRIWLNRGNHEDMEQNKKTTREGGKGFDRACDEHFGSNGTRAFEAFYSVFDWLPLAALIGGRVLVIHGGLGDGQWTLNMLGSVERPLHSSKLFTALDGVIYNILWSDPLVADASTPVETFGVHVSPRTKHSAVMKAFGRDVTEKFCIQNDLSLVIRSHQFKKSGKGYGFMHDGWLVRVFSARNYMGKHDNDAGMLLVGCAEGSPDTLLVRPQTFARMTPAKPRIGGDDLESLGGEPYCPEGHLMEAVRATRPPPLASVCLPFSRPARREEDTMSCGECQQSALEEAGLFLCRGCGYSLCWSCGFRRAAAEAWYSSKNLGGPTVSETPTTTFCMSRATDAQLHVLSSVTDTERPP